MSNDNVIKADFTPPTKDELPQGTEAFLAANQALHEALFALHAPFLNKHPGIHRNYERAQEYLRIVGFFANDSIVMISNPEQFPVPAPEKNNG